MPTKSEIRDRVLRKLRVLEEGDAATAQEITDVEEGYDEAHAWLETKSAVTWDSDEDIPDEAVRAVVSIVAARLADDFQVPEVRYQRLQVEAFGVQNVSLGALGELIDLAAKPYVSTTVEATYY